MIANIQQILPVDITSATVWLTYSQDNTSEMFINIPFIFAGSKILQLCKYFESPCGLL